MGFNRQRSESQSTDPRMTQAYLDNLGSARQVAQGLPQQQFAQPSGTFMAGREQLLSNMGFSPGTMGNIQRGGGQPGQVEPRGGAGGSQGGGADGSQGGMPSGLADMMQASGFSPDQIADLQGRMEQGQQPGVLEGMNFTAGQGGAPSWNPGEAPQRTGQAVWQPGMDAAMEGAQGVMQDAPSFLQGDIGAYMNPYQSQVIDQAMGDLDRSRQMAMQGTGDSAAAAGAFGGARHGLAEAETNRGFADQAGRMSAQLRQQGFGQAADLMGQDMNRQMQGRQQQLGASGLLGQLSGQQRDMAMGDAQAIMNLGLGEQQFGQQQLDAIRNLPLQQQEIMNQAMGLVPGGTGGTSTSSGWGVQLPTPAG